MLATSSWCSAALAPPLPQRGWLRLKGPCGLRSSCLQQLRARPTLLARRPAVRLEASLQPAPQQPPALPEPEETIWAKLARTALRTAAVGALMAALLLTNVGAAEAARSGGRMGGSSGFSSRPSSSFSSSSSSGGGYGGYGSSYSGASRTYSGFTGGSRGSYGYGAGGLPGTAPGLSVSSFFISPFGFGYGYPMLGGFNFMGLIFWGVFAVILLQVIQSVLSNRAGGYEDEEGAFYDGKVTVAKLQVGLLGSARQIQLDLERIAGKADTRSSSGLHYILQETVLALMRNPSYCLYGYAQGVSMSSAERAEGRFNEFSMEERGKFEQETLVNVGGRSRRSSLSKTASGPQELIVVTILVAAEGAFKLPKITSRTELKTALAKLGSLRSRDILAVEVLWTPEEEGDYFTQEDLAYDYPTLNTL